MTYHRRSFPWDHPVQTKIDRWRTHISLGLQITVSYVEFKQKSTDGVSQTPWGSPKMTLTLGVQITVNWSANKNRQINYSFLYITVYYKNKIASSNKNRQMACGEFKQKSTDRFSWAYVHFLGGPVAWRCPFSHDFYFQIKVSHDPS